jgi:hypothetical protein
VAAVVVTRVEATAADRGIPVPAVVSAAVDRSVRAAVATPGFAAAVRPAVIRAHEGVLDDPEAGVTVRLGALRSPVVAAIDPVLAGVVPAEEAFPTVAVPLPLGARPAVATLAALRDGWPLAIVVLLVSLVAAVLVSADRAGVLRAAGTGILALAVVPPLVRVVMPPAAEASAPPGTEAVAREFAVRVTDGWLVAAAWTAAAGLALVVVAAALRARSPAPRSRRR